MDKRRIYAVIIMSVCHYSGLYAESTPLNPKTRKITERIIIVETEQAKINLDWIQYCKRLVNDLTHEEYQRVHPELTYKDKISLHLGDISLEINNFGFTLIPEEGLQFTANFFHPVKRRKAGLKELSK